MSDVSMSDLLSAASLLLTLMGIVYGIWYAEIVAAQNADVPLQYADRDTVRGQVKAALFTKALPLAIATTVLAAIFLPNAGTIALSWLGSFLAVTAQAFAHYNAVIATFCFVEILSIALAVQTVALAISLCGKLREINRQN